MQSSRPIPGNPWPHDMLITIEDDPNALVDLLWIRAAWGLRPVGDDLPPDLADTSVAGPAESEASADVATWQEAWPSVWRACLEHAGEERDGAVLSQLYETADESPERADLLNRFIGPSWRDFFGDAAFTDDYEEWGRARFESSVGDPRVSLADDPERVSLASLIPAWRAGLTRIVVIPCVGTFTRRVGPHALLVTAETRADARRYGEALGRFAL